MERITELFVILENKPSTLGDLCGYLSENDINIEMISTSPIKISCVVRRSDGERAVRTLHDHFDLS